MSQLFVREELTNNGGMVIYVCAEREADYPLHLNDLQLMLPYFFTDRLVIYARYGLHYLRSMEAFPQNVLKCFTNGELVIRHGVLNNIWSDTINELTFMWNGHEKRGIIGVKVSKGAKIRKRYNQVPHLTQDTNGKVTNSQQTPQTRAKRSALSQQVTPKHI